MRKSAILLAVLLLFVACSRDGQGFKIGDVVLADWYQDNWHVGKVLAECKVDGENAGWTVDFEDNFYDSSEGKEAVCYTLERIVLNVAPVVGKFKVGDKLLAEWVEDAFYTAELLKVEGDKYVVKFLADGWESDVAIDKLRVKPVLAVEGKKK